MNIGYNLDKIKFSTDGATFKRAVGLYESGKVTQVKELMGNYSAVVVGTEPYQVYVPANNFKQGQCTCYVGQRGTLCKHVVALALHSVMAGKPLSNSDKQIKRNIESSRRRELLTEEQLLLVKSEIIDAMRYIKPYHGPSRTWFANQDSLQEGCYMLSAIISNLPVNQQTAEILVNLLLRLDKKLSIGGVDDSNGIVGGFMGNVVNVLEEFVKVDSECIKAFKLILRKKVAFDWHEPLIQILDESHN